MMKSMNESIPAIYTAGVFRPLKPVELAEGTQVEIRFSKSGNGLHAELTPEELKERSAAIAEFMKRMAALPDEGPNEGFSGRDHDKILYGNP